jgi:hypothetical protein
MIDNDKEYTAFYYQGYCYKLLTRGSASSAAAGAGATGAAGAASLLMT